MIELDEIKRAGRLDRPCECGSEKPYKVCCWRKSYTFVRLLKKQLRKKNMFDKVLQAGRKKLGEAE